MVNAKNDVLKSIDLAYQNKLEAIKGMTMTESLELNIMDTLSKARDQSGKIALETAKLIRIPGNITQIIEKFKNLNKQS